MNKKYLILFIVLFIPFFVYAEDEKIEKGYVIKNLNIRVEPTTESDRIACSTGTPVVFYGDVIINGSFDSTTENDNCLSKKWYKIKGKDIEDGLEYEGYGCSSFIEIKKDEPIVDTNTPNEVISETVNYYGTLNNGYVYTEPSTTSALRSGKTSGRTAILGSVPNDKSSGCEMYKILYSNLISYACKNDFKDIVEAKITNNDEVAYDYELELSKFPKGYQKYLEELHKLHPNWRFYAINTNLDFYDVVEIEKNSSYIDSYDNNASYFDTLERTNYNWATDTYIYHESNKWVTASKEASTYYIDPRTYLNEKEIFVFEDEKAYTYQSDEVIKQMTIYAGIDSEFKSGDKTYTYMEAFKESAVFSKVSSLALIARARIETNKFKSHSVTGTYEFNYNGSIKSGYYNYYNIGAFGDMPITNGLIYAYNAGWNNRYKAIIEGASFIATKYVYAGQENQYFQKFNVNPATVNTIYGHQYQTNIQAPTVESNFVYWGYMDSGNIDKPIVFNIPVYKNMPEEATIKPYNGNPNNWLKAISIDGVNINNSNDTFDGNLYYSYDNNWDNIADDIYENNVIKYTMTWDTTEINITATPVKNTTQVKNIGKIKLENKETIIDLISTAENKTTKTYRIIITKQDKPETDSTGVIVYPDVFNVLNQISIKYNDKYISGLDIGTKYDTLINRVKDIENKITTKVIKNANNNTGNFATGDTIELDNGENKTTLLYVLYGDMNGDGSINLTDLVHIRNIILEESNLSGAYKEASDINHDGKVNLTDLVLVRNDILGSYIKQ